jgi:gluconolactonase
MEGQVISAHTHVTSGKTLPPAALFAFVAALSFSSLASGQQPGAADKLRTDTFNAIFPRGTTPKLLLDGGKQEPNMTFTEGPSWMNGRLYFSNYYMYWKPMGSLPQGGPMVMEPDGAFRILNKEMQTCGTIPLGNGNLVVCDLIGKRVIEMNPKGEMVRVLADSLDGKALEGPNDVVIDAKGGIYITEPRGAKSLPGRAVLYRTPQGKLIQASAWNEFTFPNGCLLSPDGKTFYVDDSASDTVWAFDVKPDGTLASKRAFGTLVAPEGNKAKQSSADGMTIDTLGDIFVAAYGTLQVFDKTGMYLGTVRFPKSPSNCIFGGKDMKTLYVTCTDCIYSLDTNVTGLSYPPPR